MTTPVEENVHALALDGDFDDCQARLKDMFNDFAFRDEVGLAGVNSINFARVLAQIVYYFTSAVALGVPQRKISFTVPTGNFGDIFAGFPAKQMGLPVERLVIATNQNDILDRCIKGGDYTVHGVKPSMSPSMDIEISSNSERALYFAYGRDGAAITALMTELKEAGSFTVSPNAIGALREIYDSGRIGEGRTLEIIGRTLKETGELICPHTAVAVGVAEEALDRDPATPMVTLRDRASGEIPRCGERSDRHPPGAAAADEGSVRAPRARHPRRERPRGT